MIGKTISHYRILEKLGEGGMGVVYRATDTKLDRTVALKFLPPEMTRDDEARARFLHEAKAAAALTHPNICTVHEIDEAEGQRFIAMECLEGQSLRDRISSGPLELDDALNIAIQVAEGLEAAHGEGIIHRDIKPGNIMVTSSGQAKIMDFGLATSSSRTRLTRTNTVLGTFAYMSPEQSRGEEVDHRADIWSHGVMLYEMLSGRLPFQGGYEQAVVHSILNDDLQPLTGLRTGIPLQLERILDKAIAKHRDNRYQHMDDLLVDLRAVRASIGAEVESSGTEARTLRSSAAPGPRARRSMSVIGGTLAFVLVLSTLLLGLNLGGLRDRLLGQETLAPIRSLAVLPFDNMMGDAEQNFFVEGMHETLITELSKIGSLRVISRTSAMHYQGTDKSMPEIARELDVDALVEGSVLRVGDEVRITAQLIRGSNDEHIWAEDYDHQLEDILVLISEVAQAIAGEINVALTPQQEELLATKRTVDPDLYELLLRGRHHLNKFTPQDALEARRYFQQAVDTDPNYAEAHAYLAGSYLVLSIVGDMPSREIIAPTRAAAQRALELDPNLSGAHATLGFVELYFDWDWAAAQLAFQRALQLDPGNDYALHGLADVRTVLGHPDEAVELVKRGRQMDPFSYMRNVVVWVHLALAGQYEEAIAEVEHWRVFSGQPQAGWFTLYKAYYFQGLHEKAMVELRHSSTGRDPQSAPVMDQAYAESGIHGAFLVCAERLVALSQNEYVDPLEIAMYFALAGDADRALTWLEGAYEERVSAVHMIAQPALDPYRSDPRFVDLIRKIGFPEAGWKNPGRGVD